MTHDTPPKRIWLLPYDGEQRCWCVDPDPAGTGDASEVTEYILASEAEAMVAAALRDLAQRVALQMEVLSAIHQSWPLRTAGKVDAILALIQAPASAALDKLIAEAQKRGAGLESALRNLVDRDCIYDGPRLIITADSHGDAIRLASEARAALSAAPTGEESNG